MKGRRVRERFARANEYYHKKRYSEALDILDDLDTRHPKTEKIVYARARCLSRLGYHDEALELCGVLIAEFGASHAAELAGRVKARKEAAERSGHVGQDRRERSERRSKQEQQERRSKIERRKARKRSPEGERRAFGKRRSGVERRSPKERRTPGEAGGARAIPTSEDQSHHEPREWPLLPLALGSTALVAVMSMVFVVVYYGSGAAGGGAVTDRHAVLKPPRWARIVLDEDLFPVAGGYWQELESTFKAADSQDGDPLAFGIAPPASRRRLIDRFGEPDSVEEEDGITWERYGFVCFGLKQGEMSYCDLKAPRAFYQEGFEAKAFANSGG